MSRPNQSSPARANIYAIFALASAMLIGGAVGFTLGRRTPPPPRPDMSLLGVSRTTLLDSLGLTPAQRQEVERLLDDARRHADSAVTGLIDKVREKTSETRTEVRSRLDDQQRARFDSLLRSASEVLPRTPVPPRRR